MRRTGMFMAAAALLLVGVPAGAQGLNFESQNSSGGKDTFWYMPGKFKSVDADGKATIVLLGKETVYRVNPSNHTYTRVTFAELKQMTDAGLSAADEMMKKRLESLPPEKRKELEARMSTFKQSMHAEVKYDVENTGESKTISGYSCTKYIVKRNGKEFQTIWATKALGDLPTVHKDMEELSTKLASVFNSRNAPLGWFKDIPGFPVETDQFGTTHTVTRVTKQSVPDAEFEVPAGYTMKSMNSAEGMDQ